MIRGSDLEKLLRDLRPTYDALRKAEADLKTDEVRQTMKVRTKVERQAGEAREIISDRARQHGVERDAMIAILSASFTLRKRLGRKPSIRQIASYSGNQQAGTAAALGIAEREAIKAAEHAETLRKRREVWAAACVAVTGYPS